MYGFGGLGQVEVGMSPWRDGRTDEQKGKIDHGRLRWAIALHTTPGVVHENKVQNLRSSVWRTLDLWQGHTILLPSSVQSPAQREGLWPSAAQLSITFLQVWDKQCLLLPQPPLHTHLGPWSDQSIDIAWSPPIPLSFSFVEFFIPIDRSGNR